MPSEFVKVALSDMASEGRDLLWRQHIRETAATMDLTPRQRVFVFSSLSQLQTFRADSSALQAFADQSLVVLTKEESFRLFGQLNPDASRIPGASVLAVSSNEAMYGRDCNCNQMGDFCDWGLGPQKECQAGSGCYSGYWCGWFLLQRCNGLCGASKGIQ